MKTDNGYVIKKIKNINNKKIETYYCGLKTWDPQLRKAKIYHSINYVNDIIANSPEKDNLTIVSVAISES